MAFTFCQTGLEKKFLSQIPPPLAQALKQIAQALPAELECGAPGIPAFFRDFIDGFWTPFEEVCDPDTERLQEANQAVRALEQKLKAYLDQEHFVLLDQFCDAVNTRSTEELEHAFLVGYQAGIRLLLLGILPLRPLIQEAQDDV